MSAHGTEARVSTLPQCDFCKDTDSPADAAYDGRTAWGWAFMCESHWQEHGPGSLGLGIGQRLVLDEEPEDDDDCKAHPSYEQTMEDSLNGVPPGVYILGDYEDLFAGDGPN